MKHLSTKTFYGVFNVVFYLVLLFSVAVTCLEIMKWVRPEVSANYSFTFIEPETLSQPTPEKVDLSPEDADVKNPYLITNGWRLTFNAAGAQIRAYMSALAFVFVAFILVVAFTMRSFVLSLQRNETFTDQNIKRLQRIGFLFLLIEPFQWFTKYIVNHWLADYFNLSMANRSISYQIGHTLGYTLGSGRFLMNWIVVGLIVLVIAEVFKQGLKLKEEVDLTV